MCRILLVITDKTRYCGQTRLVAPFPSQYVDTVAPGDSFGAVRGQYTVVLYGVLYCTVH